MQERRPLLPGFLPGGTFHTGLRGVGLTPTALYAQASAQGGDGSGCEKPIQYLLF